MLFGREREEAEIARLLAEAREGVSGALALLAEPGAGKSALVRRAAELAAGFRVLRCTGIESESDLPFAGLQVLLAPVTARIEAIPEAQADALRAALGLAAPGGADRFLVGLATLSVLAEASAEEPVLCLVDDAQWLDRPSAEALAFAARRLAAEGVVLLFAGREEFSVPGVAELRLGRLDRAAARELVDARSPGLPGHVRDRVLAEAGGNPLALIELPRMDADSLTVGPIPLPHRLQEAYQRRIADLPADRRAALLVAAAEESGDLGTVLKVMDGLGLAADALAAAEQAGLVEVTGQSVAFRHPLMRAASYQGAPFTQRLAVHRAIASTVDDPDRRAWHRAAAVTEADEDVATELEAAAERARGRSGHASAVSALERAARLSTAEAARGRRLMAAGEAAVSAGQAERAGELAAEAERLTTDPRELARVAGVRAWVEFERGHLVSVHEVLMARANGDPELSAVMMTDAARAAWNAADLRRIEESHAGLLELPPDPVRDVFVGALGGLVKLARGEAGAGVAVLREHADPGDGSPSVLLNVALYGMLTGDMERSREILAGLAEQCRTHGLVGWLPGVLGTLGSAEVLLGRLREAEMAATEGARIAADTGQANRVAHCENILALVLSVQGEERRCREIAERNLAYYGLFSNVVDAFFSTWSLARLDLGAGRYESVLDRLEAVPERTLRFIGNCAVWVWADQIEAAHRIGDERRAAGPLERLERWTEAVHSPSAEALLLRCRGEYERALELHGDRAYDRARTRLLYGEWLRRERRKTEARGQLRGALETFERLGAVPWADHARNELRAAGEGAPVQEGGGDGDLAALLTPQEYQVVRLAATGATNKEIGAQLFLSPKTVSHHLYRAFPKLGVSTRTELARLDL